MTGTAADWLPVALAVALGMVLLVQVLRLVGLRRPGRHAVDAGRSLGRPVRRSLAGAGRAGRRGGGTAAAALSRWSRRRPTPRQALLAAVVVGGLVRLAWVIWATRTPTGLRDPAEYLRIAVGFSHAETPRFGGGGDPSAFWPPGYPAMLAPFVWVARQTGWASTAFVASLVNVVAGTVTVALSGVLAGRWIGPRARIVAAWLVALCPGLIYWTSTPHTETAFTPVFLGAIALSSAAATSPSRRRWLLVGVLVAVAFLVRSPGVIALAAPALALRATNGSWRGAAKATATVALVAGVLLVPWALRNGIQVGVWTPASTNNAGAVCFGHHDEAPPLWEPEKLSEAFLRECYRNSPYDDVRFEALIQAGGDTDTSDLSPNPDEAAWYSDAMAKGIRWALTHPTDEVRLSADKLWETWSSEGRVVDGARNYEYPEWAGWWHGPLGTLADWWGWVVGAMALAALALVPACRRALPIWVPIVLYTVMILGGVIDPHYRYPVVPLVAVLASGLLARPREDVGEAGETGGADEGAADREPAVVRDNGAGDPAPAEEEMSV